LIYHHKIVKCTIIQSDLGVTVDILNISAE